ncbi:MAG TPA: hypothetical protein VFU32_11210 [Ktedonobacterales bacterium]|nr:hypothetical protein [Ktedonobacterales bacterium]
MKKLLKRITLSMIWHVLAGFLPGVVIGLVIGIVGLFTLSPEPNQPPAYQDNSPGAITIQVSQSYLDMMTAQNVNGAQVPVPPFGSLPLKNAHAQTKAGDTVLITGQVTPPLAGTRQVVVNLTPCITKQDRPNFDVVSVQAGGQDITSLARSAIQQKLASAFQNLNVAIPNAHLAHVLTSSSALVLIYSTSGSGGQPACHSG